MDPAQSLSSLFDDIFASKPADKRKAWLSVLLDEEFETVPELRSASEEVWNALKLPLAIKDALKQAIKNPQPQAQPAAATQVYEDTRPIVQLDSIVFDISSSMNSKSFDPLNTRLGLAKTLFHTMVDKYVGLELAHSLSLVLFGQNTRCFPFTRQYETFHDTLGDAAAKENATKLWDSIQVAANQLIEYKTANASLLDASCRCRIFCLTDGEDNASVSEFWQVAQMLQKHNIVLDSIPLATSNDKLQAMAVATGGLCLKVLDAERGVALFEREAIISLASREPPSKPLPYFSCGQELLKHAQGIVAVEAAEDIKAVVPQAVTAKVMTQESIKKIEQTVAVSTGSGANATRRLMKEYNDLQTDPVPGVQFFVTESDILSWKIILKGPEDSPYKGGTYLIYLSFPSDYPFKPPKLQFITPIYHCNISTDGRVCLEILRNQWSPALTAGKVLQSISSLLVSPNPDDALDAVKANVYSDNRQQYFANAKEHCLQHANVPEDQLKQRYNF